MVRNGHWILSEGPSKVKGKLPTPKPNGTCLPALPRESSVPVEGCGRVFSPPSQDRMGMLDLTTVMIWCPGGTFTMVTKAKITRLLLLDEMSRHWIVQKV